jgi:hypothetical protein
MFEKTKAFEEAAIKIDTPPLEIAWRKSNLGLMSSTATST